MCLSLVTERPKPELEGVFYKFLGETGKELWSPCRGEEEYRLKRWEKARGPKRLGTDSYPPQASYPTGFHGFESITDAKKHWLANDDKKLYRCKFRKGHTVGVEDDSVVIVAGEMLILGPVSEEEWNNV